jgi:hypothetical protein
MALILQVRIAPVRVDGKVVGRGEREISDGLGRRAANAFPLGRGASRIAPALRSPPIL